MSGLEQFSDTYKILGRLNEGGGGIVYKAYHMRLRKEVVLKKMKCKSVSPQINRQEVDILKNLNHPYLPQVYDFLTIGNDVYTVMSFVPGKSFQQLLNEGCHFSKRQLITWGIQLLSALEYLHTQNPPVIHSDIKPANIMLKEDGNICLIDFNIAFFLDGETVLGYTNGYTSPEQYIIAMDSKSWNTIPGHSKIDVTTDIYSVGATFYHIVTGIKRKNFKEPIDMELLCERTSEAFAQIIYRAMQTNPEKRFNSAREMLLAFEGISKRDKRYQRLLKKQRGIRIGILFLLVGFIILGGYGVHQIKLERVEKYNELVEELIDLRKEKDYEAAAQKYREAKAIFPTELEVYYQNAYSLYIQKEYQKCIEFIDYDILQNEKVDLQQERMADVYYLKADSCFKLEKYQESVEAYGKLMDIGTNESVYYRDYAISLAYIKKEKRANEILQEAIEHGLREDSIYYAKGEIEKALDDAYNARIDFEACIDITDDEELKMRSYILCSEILEEQNQCETERQILLEAEQNLPIENQLLILERLIQVDITLAENEERMECREEAIDKLNKIIEQNWDTYTTYDNLAILYVKQGELDMAEDAVEKMKEKFGEDYNIYKRLAFIEIEKQELLENETRDYVLFLEYYKEAKALYSMENTEDVEMQLLDNVYLQLERGGWTE